MDPKRLITTGLVRYNLISVYRHLKMQTKKHIVFHGEENTYKKGQKLTKNEQKRTENSYCIVPTFWRFHGGIDLQQTIPCSARRVKKMLNL